MLQITATGLTCETHDPSIDSYWSSALSWYYPISYENKNITIPFSENFHMISSTTTNMDNRTDESQNDSKFTIKYITAVFYFGEFRGICQNLKSEFNDWTIFKGYLLLKII